MRGRIIYGGYGRPLALNFRGSSLRPKVYRRDGGVCALCRLACGGIRSPLWQADHVIPVAFGGEHTLANARTLCVPCHRIETRRLRIHKLTAARADGPPLIARAMKDTE